MKKLVMLALVAAPILGCGPAVPDCDPDENLKWIPCGGQEPDTCGSWECVPNEGTPTGSDT